MNKIVLTILGAFLIASCSACNKRSGTVTQEYNKFFDKFNSDLQILGYPKLDFSQTVIKISDNLTDDHGNIVSGHCEEIKKKNYGFTEIYFLSTLPPNENTRQLLVYHEIGHCFLGLRHKEGNSIMTDKELRAVFDIGTVSNETYRLNLVKEMLEDSKNILF